MKRILSVTIALIMALMLASCGKDADTAKSSSSTVSSTGFVKPEQYASVLLVTINPQFKLYLDENGTVLAVEAVNDDAESIRDSISFEKQNFETVIKSIVTTANEKGFVKEDATVNFEIIESAEADTAVADILTKAQKTANDAAIELKIEITVKIIETTASVSSTVSSAPAHTHSYAAATCTEPKKCSCGAVEGKALGHNYKDGVCTRCKAKDPNFKTTSVLNKQGKWTLKYLNKKELYSVSVIICNSEKNSAGLGIGDLLSTLPPDMQNDPNIGKYCEKFNGESYYIGRGTGDDITTVKEDGNTVTLTDTEGNKLVLTRTGENTLKCTSASDVFADINGIPVGSVFTFVAG